MDIITNFVKILTLKRDSQSTIDSYRSHLLLTKSHFGNKTFKQIRDCELFEFVYHPVDSKNISASYCELCNKPGIGRLPLKRKLLPQLLAVGRICVLGVGFGADLCGGLFLQWFLSCWTDIQQFNLLFPGLDPVCQHSMFIDWPPVNIFSFGTHLEYPWVFFQQRKKIVCLLDKIFNILFRPLLL